MILKEMIQANRIFSRHLFQLVTVLCLLVPMATLAGPRDQAFTLYKRLTGIHPSPEDLNAMADLISQGKAEEAAQIAMSHTAFYNITLRNFAAPLTNSEASAVVPLNDGIAMAIGIVKDNRPFTEILTARDMYVANEGLVEQAYQKDEDEAEDHFAQLENTGAPLHESLRSVPQSQFHSGEAAGILTTQSFGKSFLLMGTNRRMFAQGLVRNFWCSEIEEIQDVSMPMNFIRRDVDRAPGGSTSVFMNKCVGCHSLMDAMVNAFNYFDYSNNQGLVYRERGDGTDGVSGNGIQRKTTRNGNVYPDGYVPQDDRWVYVGNQSTAGTFDKFGWSGNFTGRGVHSLATAFAQSRGFSQCMAKRVFKQVCLKKDDVNDKGLIELLTRRFEQNQYDLKDLYVATATRCMGE